MRAQANEMQTGTFEISMSGVTILRTLVHWFRLQSLSSPEHELTSGCVATSSPPADKPLTDSKGKAIPAAALEEGCLMLRALTRTLTSRSVARNSKR